MKVVVIKGTLFFLSCGSLMNSSPFLAESSIFANDVCYILAVASSATSSGSACADTCQPVTALDNAIIGPFVDHK